MKKFILIPDSFKGTMSSTEICGIMENQIKRYYPQAEVIPVPVADGGEGSVDCFLQALDGEKIKLRTQGPFGEKVESFYGVFNNGQMAVIEMAASAGLPLAEGNLDPTKTSTYGVGELILDAAQKGSKKIIVGLGGSATNDGGCGAACAVGIKFYDRNGKSFIPTGGSLKDISHIDCSQKASALEGVEVVAMCDIDNPMYGPSGAAHIFGPQKGASPKVVAELDKGVTHLSEIIKSDLKLNIVDIPGTGAAGAMGAGMIAFFGANLQMGIETVLDAVNYDHLVSGSDMVLTGEGKIDGQSLRGKVVVGVARRTKKKGIPVVAIVGDIGDDIEPVYQEGVSAIFSINRIAADFSVLRKRCKSDLSLTVDNLLRLCKNMNL